MHQDISVAKLALDNEKSNFPKTARLIHRKEIARDGMPYLTGALASDGVVDGAVEEAGVRIVR